MTHDYAQYTDGEAPKANPDKGSDDMVEGFHHRAVCQDCEWENWRCLRPSAVRAKDGHIRNNPEHRVNVEAIDDWETLAAEESDGA